MTRRFWGLVMIFALLLTVLPTVYIMQRMEQQAALVTVPLKDIPPPPQAQVPAPVVSTAAAVATVAPVTASTETAAAEIGDPDAKRDIVFSYKNSNAKRVAIIGDFNEWFRKPMKKGEKGVWRTTVKLAPGSYEYLLVADDRRLRDPNAKKTSDNGHSVIVVKPLVKK